ncbi:MAG: outer membrane protein assembly factor BamE [Rhizobiaceae bacterium]
MRSTPTTIKSKTFLRTSILAAAFSVPMLLSGCNSTKEVLSHGYQMNEDTLALVTEGSSREQVLLALGSPSTTQKQQDGTQTFYYISQQKSRSVAFIRPTVVSRRILAVYFGADGTVTQKANYGLKDGKVFDFVSRVTPTGGKDLSFIGQLLSASPNPGGLFKK